MKEEEFDLFIQWFESGKTPLMYRFVQEKELNKEFELWAQALFKKEAL